MFMRVREFRESLLMRAPPRWLSGKDVHLESDRPGFGSCFRHGSFVCLSVCVCVCVCVCVGACVCVCVCLSVYLSIIISLCSGLFLCTAMRYIDFVGVLFFCLIGCFSMIVWTPTVFECLICMRFLFLYMLLFSAIEHVSHGKAL